MQTTVFFDMDGTVNDSFDGITRSVVYALEKMGITPPADRRALSPFIGPPLYESFSAIYKMTDKDAHRAVEFYREYYGEYGIFDNRVYDGVPEMLAELKAHGAALYIATSKPEVAAKRIVEHFGLSEYFNGVFGASLDDSRTTKIEVLGYALKTAGATAAASVMVGDRHHDIDGAKLYGLKSIGVLYGYGSEDELKKAGADSIAATPSDVVKIILG